MKEKSNIPHPSRRSVATVLCDLYGSPRDILAAYTKAAAILRSTGWQGLLAACKEKLHHPNLPISKLIGQTPEHVCPFEERQDWPGRGLCTRYSVTMVILTRGNQGLIEWCLASIRRSVLTSALLDVVVVNNGEPIYLPDPYPWPIRLVRETSAFNWSAYNNAAAATSSADYLLFLNDDVAAIRTGWLDTMLQTTIETRGAIVGAKLLYPDGTIQHLGVHLSISGETTHISRHFPRHGGHVPEHAVQVAAVTGACLLTPRLEFNKIKGFEERLAFSFNDVDYCLRAKKNSVATVVDPHVEMVHLETATRPLHTLAAERTLFRSRWVRGISDVGS